MTDDAVLTELPAAVEASPNVVPLRVTALLGPRRNPEPAATGSMVPGQRLSC
ncbi:MAG: hypothetical protein ABR608_02375 [Pseudonocardiaceae bacterium]